jgi:hypothetical protein
MGSGQLRRDRGDGRIGELSRDAQEYAVVSSLRDDIHEADAVGPAIQRLFR